MGICAGRRLARSLSPINPESVDMAWGIQRRCFGKGPEKINSKMISNTTVQGILQIRMRRTRSFISSFILRGTHFINIPRKSTDVLF